MWYLLDVVGIGALNIDYLVTRSVMDDPDRMLDVKRAGEAVADYSTPLEAGVERVVDADTMRAALGEIDLAAMRASPGGSAFNAIHALARTGLGARTGYVGISGALPTPGPTAHEHLDSLGIDRRWVRVHDELLGGVCLSIMDDGLDERTLLVHPGANALMAEHLRARAVEVVKYLAASRVVHVTSFLDDLTPAVMALVLDEVRRTGTGTRIVVDPGHVWCDATTDDVEQVIATADYLLLNDVEFRMLGQAPAGLEVGTAEHRAVADGLLERLPPGASVVHKQSDAVWRFSADRLEVYRHELLGPREIEDSTGAGDVFAAGLLAALATDAEVAAGLRLGMAMARMKIQFAGADGHHLFAGIAASYLPR